MGATCSCADKADTDNELRVDQVMAYTAYLVIRNMIKTMHHHIIVFS